MKVLYAIFVLLVVGCSNKQTETETNYEKVDSILNSSKTTLIKSDSITKRSEAIIAKKIDRTVAKIQDLKEEATEAKNALNTASKVVKVIRVVDTVYIEKRRNFWGREKEKVTTVSDSTLVEDSTIDN